MKLPLREESSAARSVRLCTSHGLAMQFDDSRAQVLSARARATSMSLRVSCILNDYGSNNERMYALFQETTRSCKTKRMLGGQQQRRVHERLFLYKGRASVTTGSDEFAILMIKQKIMKGMLTILALLWRIMWTGRVAKTERRGHFLESSQVQQHMAGANLRIKDASKSK